MSGLTGSNPDFHPADRAFNSALNRHRGRCSSYRPSPLSIELTPETVSTSEATSTDHAHRPQLTINISDIPSAAELDGHLADTPNPSTEEDQFPPDEGLGIALLPSLVESSEVLSKELGLTSRSSANASSRTLTPLHEEREALRNMLQEFGTYVLEPGERQPDLDGFRAALEPATQKLAADQIIHAIKHHLPSVQRATSQIAQLRGALHRVQHSQEADLAELKRLRAENTSLRGALDRLSIPNEEAQQVRNLAVEIEQIKTELAAAQKDHQENSEQWIVEEGNRRLEVNEIEAYLAALRKEYDLVLADRQQLRATLRRAEGEIKDACESITLSKTQLATTEPQRPAAEVPEPILALEEQHIEGGEQTSDEGEILRSVRYTPPPPTPSSFAESAPSQRTSTPLQEARHNLLIRRPLIDSIIDPLEESGYNPRSVRKAPIREALSSDIDAAQIVRALKDHLPEVQHRERIKAAYNTLEMRFRERGRLIQRLKSDENPEIARWKRQTEAYKARWAVLDRKMKEFEEAEERRVELEDAEDKFEDALEVPFEKANPTVDSEAMMQNAACQTTFQATKVYTSSDHSSQTEPDKDEKNNDTNESELELELESLQRDFDKLAQHHDIARNRVHNLRTFRRQLRAQNADLLAASKRDQAKIETDGREIERLTKELESCLAHRHKHEKQQKQQLEPKLDPPIQGLRAPQLADENRPHVTTIQDPYKGLRECGLKIGKLHALIQWLIGLLRWLQGPQVFDAESDTDTDPDPDPDAEPDANLPSSPKANRTLPHSDNDLDGARTNTNDHDLDTVFFWALLLLALYIYHFFSDPIMNLAFLGEEAGWRGG